MVKRTNLFEKSSGGVLDYTFDFAGYTNGNDDDPNADWLGSSETISSHTVSPGSGITLDSDELVYASTGVRVWLSGGTSGEEYTITCEITTNQGRTTIKYIRIYIL